MLSIGQNPKVSHYAQKYVNLQLIVILLAGINDAQKRFLTCYKKNFAPMMTNLVNTLMYPLWCYIFIIHLNMGILGCAMSDLVSMVCTLAFNLLYTYSQTNLSDSFITCQEFRSEFNQRTFKEQFMLGLWSTINSIIEGFSSQMIMIVSGFLSVTDQAANTIIMNVAVIL